MWKINTKLQACGLWLAACSHLILFLVLIDTRQGFAQHPGFTVVNNLAEFKNKFLVEGKKILSIRSSFVQEKSLSVLEEKINSEGKFWFQREQKVRIEYQKPFRYLLIINGDQILMRDEQKETRVSAHANKLFQQINRIIVECLNGAILENKDFSPHIFQNEKLYLLEMTPVSKTMKDFFQTINITLDNNDFTVISIALNELGGDTTVIRFSNKELNVKLDEALFVR